MNKISIARNPRARHDYHLFETWEAGLVLTGTEVKSLREGKASLGEAYAHVQRGEVWLEGLTISPYAQGSYNNPPPTRSRKLLLHKSEIRKLIGGEIDAVNRTLSSPEQVKKFVLLPKRLYQEDGDVTPTMKVKRRAIMEKFGDLIDAVYRD